MEHARQKSEVELWEEFRKVKERSEKHWEKVIRFDTVTFPIFATTLTLVGLVIGTIVGVLIGLL